MSINQSQSCWIVAICLVAMTGCMNLGDQKQSKDKSFLDQLRWPGKDKDATPEPYPHPVKVAATWSPDTLVQTGRVPTRGFGGRVFFYDEKSRAVPVDGTLIVHGFDDAADDPAERVKRFEFTPEQFTRHFSQSDLGASYSIWIPWDRAGGDQRRISLVTSFTNSDGTLLQGMSATVLLPGNRAELGEEGTLAEYSPKYREYLQAARSPTSRRSGLTTTTITRRRVSRAPQELSPQPAATLPMIAQGTQNATDPGATPALDIPMLTAPKSSGVMPASAELPIQP